MDEPIAFMRIERLQMKTEERDGIILFAKVSEKRVV